MKNLDRFIEAQKETYELAFNEIKKGRKVNHFMWYIFPQIKGLGQSEISKYYEISDLEEAKEYLNHELLGKNLLELSNLLLELDVTNIKDVFGDIDSMKLKSCMTLFDYISANNVFSSVLDKFFNGKKDDLTIFICNKMNEIMNIDISSLRENFKTDEEYDALLNDIKVNLPKYKDALYNYYKSINEEFPFDKNDFSYKLILVIFLNEYGYSKKIVLKALDNVLLSSITNKMEVVLVINFLYGFGIIEKIEMDERNPYIALMSE